MPVLVTEEFNIEIEELEMFDIEITDEVGSVSLIEAASTSDPNYGETDSGETP